MQVFSQSQNKTPQKKAIVLFITLMFIAVLSSLIVKNLSDTSTFIDESNKDTMSVKSLIALKNIKEEFLDYFVKNADQIDILLDAEPFKDELILEYADVTATIKFVKYEEKLDINSLALSEQSKYKAIEDLFATNSISGFYDFRQLIVEKIKLYGSIENFVQLESILEEFILLSQSRDILNIKDELSFLTSSNQNLLLCNLDIKISNESLSSSFLYDLSSKSIKGLTLAF